MRATRWANLINRNCHWKSGTKDMATLSELAAAADEAAKKKPLPASPSGGGMKLNARERAAPKPPPVAAWEPAPPAPSPRQLGADCCGECLPMDWPESDPEATWEESRHGLPSQTAIVLSQCGRWAWLCLLPCPNYPRKPLLLHRWPVAGTLTQEAGGLAVIESPSATSHGEPSAPASSPTSPAATAPSAGSNGDAP